MVAGGIFLRALLQRSVYLLTLATVLVACAAPAAPTRSQPVDGSSGSAAPARPAGKKSISLAIAGEPKTLSDTINQSGSGGVAGVAELESMIHLGVVYRHGETGEVLPHLIEASPTLENGLWKVLPDGRMETTLTLRPDAMWHDGTLLTTDDLVFTAKVAQDPEIGALAHIGFRSVDRVEARDARTLTVFWKRPYIDADTLFSERFGLPLPKHILEQTYNDDKPSFLTQPYWTEKFIGSGAYRIRDFVPGSHLILTANEHYLLGKPKIDEIEVRFIQDAQALIANLLSGTVQMTLGRRLSIEQGFQVANQWPDGQMLVSSANWIALYPQFVNPNPVVIANLEFRRALMYAMNRQQISEVLTNGLAGAADGPVSPSQPEYKEIEKSITRYPYDPNRAIQMIQSLGYTRGSDGTFVDNSGQKLSVENRTTAGDDVRGKMLLSIADDWQKAGVVTETNIVPRQRADDREYRATRPGFELVRQPIDPNRSLGSEAPLPSNNFRGNSRTRIQSPELDAIIDRYYTTIPHAERMQALSEFVGMLTSQVIIMGVIYNVEPVLVNKRITGVVIAKPDGVRDSWNSHEWDLK
jgi:peptide/nickel transport system substrate-binding protein